MAFARWMSSCRSDFWIVGETDFAFDAPRLPEGFGRSTRVAGEASRFLRKEEYSLGPWWSSIATSGEPSRSAIFSTLARISSLCKLHSKQTAIDAVMGFNGHMKKRAPVWQFDQER